MKIRSGFVSNSSSSSFVIFGKRIGNPEKAIKEGKKVFVHLDGGGTSGEAEDWGMWLDTKCWNLLKESDWFKYYTPHYFECPDTFEASKEKENAVSISSDIEGLEIFGFNRDYSSPDTYEQLVKFLEDVGC